MTEISNIDAIIELIMREARARKGPNPIQKILEVHSEVFGELIKIFDNLKREVERNKKEGRQHEWAKGM